jgi:predicted RNA-binding Zn ribbon-like protein
MFAHDTEVSLAMAAALVNTVGSGDGEPDALASGADLEAFAREWNTSGRLAVDADDVERARALRAELRRVWEAGDPDVVAPAVNALLAEAPLTPRLVRHDGWDWHLHATGPDQPLVTRLAVEVAMALVDVVRSGETGRLRVCEADGCERVHVDLSRNRSRRYCSTTCGNRSNVAAYRARQAAGDSGSP